MLGRDIADKLLDDNGLANSRSAIGADLAASCKRSDKVDHLQARLQDVWSRLLLSERLAQVGESDMSGQHLRRRRHQWARQVH